MDTAIAPEISASLRGVQHGQNVNFIANHSIDRDVVLVQHQFSGAVDAAGFAELMLARNVELGAQLADKAGRAIRVVLADVGGNLVQAGQRPARPAQLCYTPKCNLRGLAMEATTKDLRLHSAELLAATDRGDAVVITYRGRRRAILQRWEESRGRLPAGRRNPAFGMWADASDDVAAQVRALRAPRALP